MRSFRSYLVDALIRFILDEERIPHVTIQCDVPGVTVPEEFVNDNQLILNVSPQAVTNFQLDVNGIEFDTRFNGVTKHIHAPVGAIVGVFARGSDTLGMTFEPLFSERETKDSDRPSTNQSNSDRSHLKFVK